MKLDDEDLVKVLPIHPYSAVLLKFIFVPIIPIKAVTQEPIFAPKVINKAF